MKTIDTWEGLGAALAADLPAPVKQILTATHDRLEEFRDQPLNTLCTILILEEGDRLDASLDPALAEYIAETDGWFELVFVIGDDGQGLVLLTEDQPDTDPNILSLCQAHAVEAEREDDINI